METRAHERTNVGRVLAFTRGVLVLLTTGSWGASIALDHPPDVARIKARGKLIIGVHRDERAPFYMHSKSGKFYGLDVELARDIAANLGVEAEFVRTAKYFDNLIDQLENQEVDLVISKLSITTRRAQRILYTKPYLSLPQVLLVNRLKQAGGGKADHDPFAFVGDREGRIGVLGNSSYEDFVRNQFPNAAVVRYDDRNRMYRDVEEGRLPAALHDGITINTWLKDNPKATIRVRAMPNGHHMDPVGIAVQWKDTFLRAWLDTYLEVAQLNGTLDRLKQKYIATDDWRNEP